MLSFLFDIDARAGVLKGGYAYAKPEHFFDWRYVQKVWFEMNTRGALEKEEAQYTPDFDPWLELYKKDPRKALDALKSYSETKRRNIMRGYDIQLAYDQWFDQVYSPWYNGYAYAAHQAPIHKKKAPTFDDYLAIWAKRPACIPTAYLNDCGPVPDWRSEKWVSKELDMMQRAQEAAAKAHAGRK